MELKVCPFCGAIPEVKYIGNNATKKRSIKIKCSNKSCRIERTESTIYRGHDSLELYIEKHWNKRIK